ncbi:MAG: NAD(P)-dependent oxidoreductase [Thermodesulfovibrionales bacterium]|nr:NAD(P)-dependent oxidoreductase [Thermodesulfovibrionales bacterium]
MSESPLKITQTPIDEIKYSVSIKDEYFLHLKDADCVRTITYVNEGLKSFPVDFKKIDIAFFSTCENFTVSINSITHPGSFKEDYENYSKIVRINYSGEVEPGKKLEIQIRCKWKNFVSSIDDSFFTFTFPEKTRYKLIIQGIPIENRPYFFHIGDRKAEKNKDYFITSDSIIFNDIDLDTNNPVRIRLLVLSTAKTLSTLHFFADNDKVDFSEYIIILIQHLLSDFIHLVDALEQNKADKSNIFIIGIPYSTKDKTVKYLKLSNYKNLTIPQTYPFDDQVRLTMLQAIDLAMETGKQILIIEDGGYAVPILHKEYYECSEHFVGAVEQTANGIWKDEELYKELLKCKRNYCIPIMDVARSDIKLRLESPLIGRAVYHNIALLLGKDYLEIAGKKVGVAGFGNTGSRIVKTLRDMGANVTIFSDKKIDLSFAKAEGYNIADTAEELIKNCRIIIEATGREWAGVDAINFFQNNSYFVSASSKRLGIKYSEFMSLINTDKVLNVPGIGVKYEIISSGNAVTLLADGYPVNFFDSESVPDKAIEFIPTILFESAKFLVRNSKLLPKDIVEFRERKDDSEQLQHKKKELIELQDKIADKHYRFN